MKISEDIRNLAIPLLAIGILYGIMRLAGITCPIRYITGISCAGCGMTRASFALVSGHVHEAVYYHPLVFILPVLIFLYFIRRRMSANTKKAVIVFTVFLFIAVYLYRMTDPANEIVVCRPETGLLFKLLIHR